MTVDLDGERLGLTVASLTPSRSSRPSWGFRSRKQAALHELLRAAAGSRSRCWARVRSPSRSTSRAASPRSRCGTESTSSSPRGPLLGGALGWLECALAAEHDAGDHTLFVGRVERAEPGVDAPPLVRLGGEYRGG